MPAFLARLGWPTSRASPPATVTRRPRFFTCAAARLSSEFLIIFKLSSASINLDELVLAAAAARRASVSPGGASSAALRFPARSAGGLVSASAEDADAETDEDASWRSDWAVSEAQSGSFDAKWCAGSVRDVGRLLILRLVPTDKDGAGLLSMGRPWRSQLGLGYFADVRVDGVLVSWWAGRGAGIRIVRLCSCTCDVLSVGS